MWGTFVLVLILLCSTLCPFHIFNYLAEKEEAGYFVLCLFFMVPLVGLQCMIVVFPDHTHLVF